MSSAHGQLMRVQSIRRLQIFDSPVDLTLFVLLVLLPLCGNGGSGLSYTSSSVLIVHRAPRERKVKKIKQIQIGNAKNQEIK
jgi:hypothetical protein